MWTSSGLRYIVLWNPPFGCTTARGHDATIFIPVAPSAIKMTSSCALDISLMIKWFVGQVIHVETQQQGIHYTQRG